ncbi:hypothetical protein Baya_11488 [Bagarius yarrelli]|uniref:Uncharacterized protein n=1 Tax=Bagarius yarrelli TaxID=175774 RepID=A0A556V097_BAGYA|nr:hypothetical protein Baya_11488 [Bagarius yarrelli]
MIPTDHPVCDVSEPKVIEDIAVDDEHDERNADPCTSSDCMWPKSSDGKVYVPYVIANHFSYKYAFDKISTLNQGTPYDYNCVMQYHRFADPEPQTIGNHHLHPPLLQN